jgi:L-lactate utilization protein LutB
VQTSLTKYHGKLKHYQRHKEIAMSDTEEKRIDRIGAARSTSPFVAGRESAWDCILQLVAGRLAQRGFGVSIASSLKDAADLVMGPLLTESEAKVISFGGSMTVREAGLLEMFLARTDLTVLNTVDMSIGMPAMLELRRQALLCDLFLCSVNAMTRDGEMVLVDGFGNRTAAVQYGPHKVILLVGRNKICTNMDEAVTRIKGLASPANCMRLGKKTPCVKTGYCMDCNSPDRICTYWTTVQRSVPAGRIHVVLIDEECGF